MPRFRVTSGEFRVVVEEKNLRKAGDLAIQLHDESKLRTLLGQLTLVEQLDYQTAKPTGDHCFIVTQMLIDDNANPANGTYLKERI